MNKQQQIEEYRINLTSPIYRFERMRLGNKTVSPLGERYGPYLYRNTRTEDLISSWDKPKNEDSNYLYKGEDIGINTDALTYYKNI